MPEAGVKRAFGKDAEKTISFPSGTDAVPGSGKRDERLIRRKFYEKNGVFRKKR